MDPPAFNLLNSPGNQETDPPVFIFIPYSARTPFIKRKKIMRRFTAFSLLTVLGTFPLLSQDTWRLDRSHSQVEFTVTHMLISEVTGRFSDFDVSMTSDGPDLSGGSIEAVIRTASINTDNESRDNDLRGESFFNTDSFPTATFNSTKIEKAGENKFRATGDLTIRGITKPVVMDISFLGTVTDGRGRVKSGWKGLATINRFDYGVRWDRTLDSGGLVVSSDVVMTLRLEMVKNDPSAR